MNPDHPIVVGVSGASGMLYAVRLIRSLRCSGMKIVLIVSNGAKKVMVHEMGEDPSDPLSGFLKAAGVKVDDHITVYSQDEMDQGPASGSFVHTGMVVIPCSMKTLAAVAAGYADNLITRSADVCLKENRPLILVPRETPFSLIHLENMVRAKKAGAVIMAASPSFYSLPGTIEELVDTVVARILDHLEISHALQKRWGK